jgi:hypothetical protein
VVAQVATPFPEHCVVMATHTPEHVPATQVESVHAVGVPHIPAVHVSTPFPEHWSVPGLQDPAHAPATQMPAHGEATPHCPAPSHVCTPLPLHCVCMAMHSPTHVPLTQVLSTQAVGVPHVPALVHCCEELPRHWSWPSAHSTHAPCEHTGVVPEHVAWLCQVPIGPQPWTTFPEHWVRPGLHTPMQT